MSRREDDRAVSELIGFILLFSFVIITFTIYQGIVVPDQNRVSEFEHNQEVQGEMQDLRNAIMSAALGGTERTVSVTLGADYPQRTIAKNLGYSGGNLRTTPNDGSRSIVIENATAVDRYGETGDYWNGSATHRFESREIVYEPTYSRYATAPSTVYENTLAYNRFGDDVNLSITGESLVDGKRITLVSLVGNLSESGTGTVSVDPEAVSASTRRISIRNETDPINVTIPTRMDASWWNQTLRQENVSQGGYVTAVRDTGDYQVSIHLKAGETYTLRMAKIGVGSSKPDEDVKYLTMTERPSRTVLNDTSHSITVEARDRFNNPVSGARVNASVAAGSGSFSETALTTSTEGEAIFNYTAPPESSTEKLRFNVTAADGGQPNYETVLVNLSVKAADAGGDGGGGTDEINPSGEGSVLLHDSAIRGGNEGADITLNNTKSSTVNFTKFRVSFVYRNGGDSPSNVDSVFEDGGQTYHGSSVSIGAPLTSFDTSDVELPPGRTTVSMSFDDKVQNSFLIVTFIDEDGDPSTYFVTT